MAERQQGPYSGRGVLTPMRLIDHLPDASFDELRAQLLRIVLERGYKRLPEPVKLASGQLSLDFVDGKEALARGSGLALACHAIVKLAESKSVEFDAAGGLTMGADQFAHGVSLLADCEWFVVRKEPKGRGTNRLVEGARLEAGKRVVLVDDVVTTGGSIKRAFEHVTDTGATVVLATALVDRGDEAESFFGERGIPYVPLLTYKDLEIAPVRHGSRNA